MHTSEADHSWVTHSCWQTKNISWKYFGTLHTPKNGCIKSVNCEGFTSNWHILLWKSFWDREFQCKERMRHLARHKKIANKLSTIFQKRIKKHFILCTCFSCVNKQSPMLSSPKCKNIQLLLSSVSLFSLFVQRPPFLFSFICRFGRDTHRWSHGSLVSLRLVTKVWHFLHLVLPTNWYK